METILDLGDYTFPAVLKNSLKKFAERQALSLVWGKTVTYAEMGARAAQISQFLLALGLKPYCKIAIFGTGRPEWGQSYFAIVNTGMIAVPLLPDFSETEVEAILKHCEVDGLIVEDRLWQKIKGLDENILPKVVIKLDDLSLIKGDSTIRIEAERQNFSAEENAQFAIDFFSKYEVREEDTASIIYTSGTTGRSKGVELTHRNLVWTAVQGQTMHRVNKMDRCLSFLPLSHVYEFTIGFTMQVMNGSCVYYLGKPPVVSALLPAFLKVQPTIICSVPLIMEKIYKNKVLPAFSKNKFVKMIYRIRPFQILLHRIAGSQLKKTFGGHVVFFGIGGAKMDTAVEKFLKDAKFPYAIGYGLTESSPLLAGSGPRITLPGTIGPVMEGVDLRILDPDPKTGIGEVVARGRNIMKGYYKAPDLTEASFTTKNDSCGEGFLKTGDLGTLKKKKGLVRLSLKGRSKNMILGPSGENIYPEDIEFVLNQHPLVSESLVVEDDAGLVALVQVDEEKLEEEAKNRLAKMAGEFARDIAYQKEAILSEIQYFVNSKVNKNSRVGKVRKVEKFEKTASQKIKRYLYDLRSKVTGKKNK